MRGAGLFLQRRVAAAPQQQFLSSTSASVSASSAAMVVSSSSSFSSCSSSISFSIATATTASLSASSVGFFASPTRPALSPDEVAQKAFDAWTSSNGGGSGGGSDGRRGNYDDERRGGGDFHRSHSSPPSRGRGGRGRGGGGGEMMHRGRGAQSRGNGGFSSFRGQQQQGDRPDEQGEREPSLGFSDFERDSGNFEGAAALRDDGSSLVGISHERLILPWNMPSALQHPLSLFALNPRAPEIPVAMAALLHRATAGELYRSRKVSPVYAAVFSHTAARNASDIARKDVFVEDGKDGQARVQMSPADATAFGARGYLLLNAAADAVKAAVSLNPYAVKSDGGNGDVSKAAPAAPAEASPTSFSEAPSILLPALTDAGLFVALCACADRGPLDFLAAVCYLLGPVSMRLQDRSDKDPVRATYVQKSVLCCRMTSDSIMSPFCLRAVVPQCPGDWQALHALIVSAVVFRDFGATALPAVSGADAAAVAAATSSNSSSNGGSSQQHQQEQEQQRQVPELSAREKGAVRAVTGSMQRAILGLFMFALEGSSVDVSLSSLERAHQQYMLQRKAAEGTSAGGGGDSARTQASQEEWLGAVTAPLDLSAPAIRPVSFTHRRGTTMSISSSSTDNAQTPLSSSSSSSTLQSILAGINFYDQQQSWRGILFAARALPSLLLMTAHRVHHLGWAQVFVNARWFSLAFQHRQLLSCFLRDAARFLVMQQLIYESAVNEQQWRKPSPALAKGLAHVSANVLDCSALVIDIAKRDQDLQRKVIAGHKFEMQSTGCPLEEQHIDHFDFGTGRRRMLQRRKQALQKSKEGGDGDTENIIADDRDVAKVSGVNGSDKMSGTARDGVIAKEKSSSAGTAVGDHDHDDLIVDNSNNKTNQNNSSGNALNASQVAPLAVDQSKFELPAHLYGIELYTFVQECQSPNVLSGLNRWRGQGRRNSEADHQVMPKGGLIAMTRELETARFSGQSIANSDKMLLDIVDETLIRLKADAAAFYRERNTTNSRALTLRLREAVQAITICHHTSARRVMTMPQFTSLAMKALDVWCSMQELNVPDWQWMLRAVEIATLLERSDWTRTGRRRVEDDLSSVDGQIRAEELVSSAMATGIVFDADRLSRCFYGFLRAIGGHDWTAATGTPEMLICANGETISTMEAPATKELLADTWVPLPKRVHSARRARYRAPEEQRDLELHSLSVQVRQCSRFVFNVDSLARARGKQPLVSIQCLPLVLQLMEKAIETTKAAQPTMQTLLETTFKQLMQTQELARASELKGEEEPSSNNNNSSENDISSRGVDKELPDDVDSMMDGVGDGEEIEDPTAAAAAASTTAKKRLPEHPLLQTGVDFFRPASFRAGTVFRDIITREPHIIIIRRVLDAMAQFLEAAVNITLHTSARDNIRVQCVRSIENAVDFSSQLALTMAPCDNICALDCLVTSTIALGEIVRLQRKRRIVILRHYMGYSSVIRRQHVQTLQLLASLLNVKAEVAPEIILFEGGIFKRKISNNNSNDIVSKSQQLLQVQDTEDGDVRRVVSSSKQRERELIEGNPVLSNSLLLRTWRSIHPDKKKNDIVDLDADGVDDVQRAVTPSPGSHIDFLLIKVITKSMIAMDAHIQLVQHHPSVIQASSFVLAALALRVAVMTRQATFARNEGDIVGTRRGGISFRNSLVSSWMIRVVLARRSHICPEYAVFCTAEMTQGAPLFIDPKRPTRHELGRLTQRTDGGARVARCNITCCVGVLVFYTVDELLLAERRIRLLNERHLRSSSSISAASTCSSSSSPSSAASLPAMIPVLARLLNYYEDVIAFAYSLLLREEADARRRLILISILMEPLHIMETDERYDPNVYNMNTSTYKNSISSEEERLQEEGIENCDIPASMRSQRDKMVLSRLKALVYLFTATARAIALRESLLAQGAEVMSDSNNTSTVTSSSNLQLTSNADSARRLFFILATTVAAEISTIRESSRDNNRIVEAIDGLPQSYRNPTVDRIMDQCLAVAEMKHGSATHGGAASATTAHQQPSAESMMDADAMGSEPAPRTRAEMQARVEMLVQQHAKTAEGCEPVSSLSSRRWNCVFPPHSFVAAPHGKGSDDGGVQESMAARPVLLPLAQLSDVMERKRQSVDHVLAAVADAKPIFDALCTESFLAYCSTLSAAPMHGMTRLCMAAIGCVFDDVIDGRRPFAALQLDAESAKAGVIGSNSNNNNNNGSSNVADLKRHLLQRIAALETTERVLLLLFCTRSIFLNRVRTILACLVCELGSVLTVLKKMQRDHPPPAAAAATQPSEVQQQQQQQHELERLCFRYLDVVEENMRAVTAYCRVGIVYIVDNECMSDLDFSLVRRLISRSPVPGTETAVLLAKRLQPPSSSAAHAASREAAISVAFASLPMQKLLVVIERCSRQLKAIGAATVASPNNARPIPCSSQTTLTALWLRRQLLEAGSNGSYSSNDKFRSTIIDDALTVYFHAIAAHNISRSCAPFATEIAAIVQSAETRLEPVSRSSSSSSSSSFSSSSYSPASEGGQHAASNDDGDDAAAEKIVQRNRQELEARLPPHAAGEVRLLLRGAGGSDDAPLISTARVPVTAFDVFRAIMLLYAGSQPVEQLCAKYSPVLHSQGPPTDWDLRNLGILLKQQQNQLRSGGDRHELQRIEARYKELLYANTSEQQQQQQNSSSSVQLDGRVDVTATQELNALSLLLRETRPYTLSQVIHLGAPLVPAESLTAVWLLAELSERGRSELSRRGSRNYHLYTKTILMASCNSVDATLKDISDSLLPVCDFRFQRTTASASMIGANKARVQLTERVAERVEELVKEW